MANIIKVPAHFEPRDYQLELFRAMDTGTKRAFLRWHRRAGKDLACACYIFKEMIRVPGIYYYFFPTYEQGKKAFWEGDSKEGIKTLDRMPKELIANRNNQELKFTTINGSTFRVIGTDKIDSIVGTNPRGCVFSEYALQDPQAWNYIRPILAENDGWAIFNSTPRGKNHMYHMEQNIKDSDLWYFSEMQTLWPDRPGYTGIVSPEQIQQERDEGMAEEMIEQEFGVSYNAGVQGAYYTDVIDRAERENRIGHFPADSYKYVDTFWDVGFSDDTAIWFRQIDGGRIVWVDYYENNNKGLDHYVKVLLEKGYNYRTHYIPWDGKAKSIQTGKSTIEILEELLREARLSDDVQDVTRTKIQDGIMAVRRRFSKFFFNYDTTADGLEKLGLYHKKFDSKHNVFLQKPVHDWTSHAADALRTEATQEELMEDDFYNYNNIQVKSDFNPFD